MIATITIDPSQVFEMKRAEDGSTILTLPAGVIREAYCAIVTNEVIASRRLPARPKGELVQ